MVAEVVSWAWGLGLTAGAAALIAYAVMGVVKAKQAEGDLSGLLSNAARAAFALAWACPLALVGLYALGVAGPDALAPAFVILGCLGAALLIASMVLTIRGKKAS
jgi:hypothetical protein